MTWSDWIWFQIPSVANGRDRCQAAGAKTATNMAVVLGHVDNWDGSLVCPAGALFAYTFTKLH